jgi:F-type H+-transporting ATPase subunit delta
MKATARTRRAARRLFRLCVVDGALDDSRVRHVAQRIAASRRRAALPVLAEFGHLVRLECDRHAALVESAAPLPGDLRDDIRDRLAGRYGPRTAVAFAQNPGLIGGIRIRVGSDVFDGSVRQRLAAIGARL